jgi:hypothetical protein
MKNMVMGTPFYHLAIPKEVWAYRGVGMEPMTPPLPIEQAEAVRKLLEE